MTTTKPDSYAVEKSAEQLQVARLKIKEAVEEARAALEVAFDLNEDDHQKEKAEELAGTVAALRRAEKEIENSSCWLYYEASRRVKEGN